MEYVNELESHIGIRPGFFNELIREDDWGFVIKLHAFVESCITYAICTRLGQPELEDVIARLDTSNNQTGKLAFAKKLGILNKPQRRYVTTLSQLRNNLVHDVRAVDFSLKSYMDELSAEQHYQFCVALSLDEIFEPLSEPDEIRIVSYVNEVPKFGIAYAGSIVIAKLLLHSHLGDQNKELLNLGRVVLERLTGKTINTEPDSRFD